MSKLIIPKTTTAYRETAVPKAADLLFDTDLNKMVIGDGVTPGGIVINASGGTASSEVTAGFGINVVDNEVSLKRYDSIGTLVSGGTVQAGYAYKLNATSASGTTIYAEWFAKGTFARDPAHLQIMVNGVGYLHLGQKTTAGSETAPFTLVGALEPDAMNNVTVRFHDGVAVMTVEDHIGGYVVISGGTSQATAGTLPYALVNTGEDASPYITFSSELNGTTFDITGVTVTTERHVIGNGYDETKITGDVNVGTSGTLTLVAVGLQNVIVSSGTLTLGDAYIPSGSTVAVSGGSITVEKVSGEGTINLNGSSFFSPANTGAIHSFNGITITGATVPNNFQGNTASFSDVTFTGNTGVAWSPIVRFPNNGVGCFYNCIFSSNTYANQNNTGALGLAVATAHVYVTDCTFANGENLYLLGPIEFSGENKFLGKVVGETNSNGVVTLTSGAVLDLTGNTNATPVAPGGGITFEEGGATIYPSAGQASAYMLGGITVPQIGNTNVVNLSGTAVNQSAYSSYISGCVVTGGKTENNYFGFLYVTGDRQAIIKDCIISGNSGNYGGAVSVNGGASVQIENSVISGNIGYNALYGNGSSALIKISDSTVSDTIGVNGGATVVLAGSNTIKGVVPTLTGVTGSVTISSGASINLTTLLSPGGGITVLTGGCTVNGNAIPAGTYTSIDSNGTPT